VVWVRFVSSLGHGSIQAPRSNCPYRFGCRFGAFTSRGRGEIRRGGGGIKGGGGVNQEGGGSAEGFQRGDGFWFPFLSILVGLTGVSGASPVVIRCEGGIEKGLNRDWRSFLSSLGFSGFQSFWDVGV